MGALDPARELARLARRTVPELLLEPRLHLLEVLERPERIPRRREEPDHVAVSVLRERVERERPPGPVESARRIARALGDRRELARRRDAGRPQPLALGRDPLEVEAWEELAARNLERSFEELLLLLPLLAARPLERLPQRVGVRRDRILGQLDRRARADEDRSGLDSGRLELVAERRERLAQVVAARLARGVGPEHADEELARVAPVAEEGEVREERRRLLGPEVRDGPGAPRRAELSHEVDPPGLHGPRLYLSSP